MGLFSCNYSSIKAAKFIGTGIALAIEVIIVTCIIYTGIVSSRVDMLRASIYITSLLTTGVVLGLMTYLIFIKNLFKNWFSDFGFFLYVLCVLLMFVCTLTTSEKKDVFQLIVNGLVLVLLATYTRCLSWYHTIYMEYLNEEREKYLESLPMSTTKRGQCVTIPLRVTRSKSNVNYKSSKPGTSKA
ncbi:hypothetical protein GWI33_006194 [Rhynchophorus ferrugineus]|uniref:Uncharacterized protein n=1 Tax=Rhynchophorus ferrugineus TaxID=354439 RepID=A0A834IJF1_RHYFE|nr:hypothetical protein GWI33_006194 [Rhynchophorus ferrugineus]